jgi:hypothetical protein
LKQISYELYMRSFIRHPANIPIELSRPEGSNLKPALRNVSRGGLCCQAMEPFQSGETVQIRITLVLPAFESLGRVAWCRTLGDHWEVGVQFFNEQDAFAARMVEQICHIEHYRLGVLEREGRKLSPELAAQEWISKYADRFPSVKDFRRQERLAGDPSKFTGHDDT